MRRKNSYQRLKQILQRRRSELRRVLTHDLSALQNGVGIDIGDSVDNAVDDEFNLVSSQLAESESRELAQIEEALVRIRLGRYGVCEGCGEDIPLARLQALPYATRCVICQRESEQQRIEEQPLVDWSTIRDVQEDEPMPFADHMVDVLRVQ